PTTNVLASITVQPSSVPSAIGPLPLDLLPFHLSMQQGTVLGIALSSNAAPGTQTYAWWGEAPNGPYAGGQVFIQGTTALPAWDLAFQTWVVPRGSSVNYGTGFPGTNGVPTLTASAPPSIGTIQAMLLANPSGVSTVAAYIFGLSRANLPTPFGGMLLVQSSASVTVVLPPTGGTQPFAIPFVLAYCGVLVDVQGVVLDAGAAQGIAFSPGLEL